MPRSLVKLERHKEIAVVSLNRAERHNALVPQLLSDLLVALDDDVCRKSAAIILRAEGRSFSTGGDLLAFQQHRDTIREYAFELLGLLNRVILVLVDYEVPIACAVQGQVTGGALGLLLASDRVIMHPDVSITPWYAEIGFSPDGGWTALLPGVIGTRQCMHWLVTNASHNADTCKALGLVHQLAKDCDAAAMQWAAGCARMGWSAIAATRKLLRAGSENLAFRLEAEREAFVKQVQTKAASDGIDTFLGTHNS